MGMWSTIDGSYLIDKKVKFSLKKYVLELYDELSVTYNQVDSGANIKVTFQIRFSLDGMCAAKFVDTLNKKLNEICLWQQVEATIRFS